MLTLRALSDKDRPVTVTSIRAWTAKDPILARVKALVLGGWPGDTNLCGELRTYQQRAMELSVQDGCVLWGSRVVQDVHRCCSCYMKGILASRE